MIYHDLPKFWHAWNPTLGPGKLLCRFEKPKKSQIMGKIWRVHCTHGHGCLICTHGHACRDQISFDCKLDPQVARRVTSPGKWIFIPQFSPFYGTLMILLPSIAIRFVPVPAIASIPQFPPSHRAETQEPRASIAASGALAMLADTPEVAEGPRSEHPHFFGKWIASSKPTQLWRMDENGWKWMKMDENGLFIHEMYL